MSESRFLRLLCWCIEKCSQYFVNFINIYKRGGGKILGTLSNKVHSTLFTECPLWLHQGLKWEQLQAGTHILAESHQSCLVHLQFYMRKTRKIIKDPNQNSKRLFSLLPSSKQYSAHYTHTVHNTSCFLSLSLFLSYTRTHPPP